MQYQGCKPLRFHFIPFNPWTFVAKQVKERISLQSHQFVPNGIFKDYKNKLLTPRFSKLSPSLTYLQESQMNGLKPKATDLKKTDGRKEKIFKNEVWGPMVPVTTGTWYYEDSHHVMLWRTGDFWH